jgi:hypothetical protein
MDTTTTTTAFAAYYAGRNAVWNDFGFHPEDAGKFVNDYRRGYRDAAAEMRLDADTEWDDE